MLTATSVRSSILKYNVVRVNVDYLGCGVVCGSMSYKFGGAVGADKLANPLVTQAALG